MRLDHLLSKEKIIVSLFCRLVGCWLVPGWWQVFSGGKRLVCAHVLCARVGGSVKQSGASSFLGVSASVFVFWF